VKPYSGAASRDADGAVRLKLDELGITFAPKSSVLYRRLPRRVDVHYQASS
jgi:hypothetical protein